MPAPDAFSPDNRLVSYDREPNVPIEEDILTAFHLSPLDFEAEDTVLNDYVNIEALAALRWERGSVEVRTEIWGHPVRITSDEVDIYAKGP